MGGGNNSFVLGKFHLQQQLFFDISSLACLMVKYKITCPNRLVCNRAFNKIAGLRFKIRFTLCLTEGVNSLKKGVKCFFYFFEIKMTDGKFYFPNYDCVEKTL